MVPVRALGREFSVLVGSGKSDDLLRMFMGVRRREEA